MFSLLFVVIGTLFVMSGVFVSGITGTTHDDSVLRDKCRTMVLAGIALNIAALVAHFITK